MANKLSRISIILYTIRSSPLPYAEKLKKLREIGYRSIQGGFAEGMTNQQHKQLLDDLGMEMSCFAGGVEDIVKDPQRYIEACKVFDCDEVMIGTMPTEMRENEDGYKRAVELINNAGAELKKGGIYLGYHNHAQEFRRFASGKTGMDILFEGFNPDCVHFLLDTHWVQSGGGDIIAWLNKCKGRIQYLHCKDYRIAPANFETGIGDTAKQFAQVGEGNLPWQLIVDTALSLGIKAFIFEQDYSYDEDPFDCAATAFKTLSACGLT